MTLEQDILAKIKEAEVEKLEAKSSMAMYKKAVVDAESRLIAANLKIDKLKEQLRVCRVQNPIQPETQREKDIRELKEKLPQLLEKIK